jgi:hypothetical protein
MARRARRDRCMVDGLAQTLNSRAPATCPRTDP